MSDIRGEGPHGVSASEERTTCGIRIRAALRPNPLVERRSNANNTRLIPIEHGPAAVRGRKQADAEIFGFAGGKSVDNRGWGVIRAALFLHHPVCDTVATL